MDERNAPDYFLFTVIMILAGIGIIMIFSTSGIMALEKFNDKYFFLKRQSLWLLIGITASLIAMKIDYRHYEKPAPRILLACIVLLSMVFLPGIGITINGARRWFKIGGFTFQVSELAKLVLIIYLASALSRKQKDLKNFKRGVLPLVFVVWLCFTLILLEPDFGTAMIVLAVSYFLFFVGKMPFSYLALPAVLVAPLSVFIVRSKPYMLRRLLIFLNPGTDPNGLGYHIIQSLIALGSGGPVGVGLGESTQKMFYLPEAHTDFIFAIIGEEFGFVGTFLVISLFFIVIYRGAKIALKCDNLFGALLAGGIVMAITFQAMVNIGVVTRLLPTKGITLPFISYGGSSLLINLIAVGILLNISAHNEAAT